MHTYFIVIKQLHTTITDTSVTNLLTNYGPTLITYEKPDINPHYHAILNTESSVDSIRNKISRTFTLGRGQKSVTLIKKTLEDACIYILKEQNLIHNTLLTEKQLIEYQAKTQQISKDIITKKAKNSWRKRFVDEYIPIEHIQGAPYTGGNTPIIMKHIDSYISISFRRNVELIDRFIYPKFFNLIILIYYPALWEIQTNQWLQQAQQNYIGYN